MSQLTAKELRFSNMAVSALANGPPQQRWNAWYQSNMVQVSPRPAFTVVPRDIADVVLLAIQSLKSRIAAELETADADESESINDLELFLHIEQALKLDAAA